MAESSDLTFQKFSTVQGSQSPKPNTLAAAATIAPSHFLTLVTGTTQVENITPPVAGAHMLVLIFTNAAPGTFLTTGNVLNACVPTQNQPTICIYDPNQAKYYVTTTNLT